MINAREIFNDFVNGVGKLSETNGDFIGKFVDIDGFAGSGSGVIDDKTKELICVAIGIYNRCQYCICVHTRGAYQAGASRAGALGELIATHVIPRPHNDVEMILPKVQ